MPVAQLRLAGPATPAQGHSQVGPGGCQVGVDSDSILEPDDGFVKLLGPQRFGAPVRVVEGGRREIADRRHPEAPLVLAQAEIDDPHRVPGPESHGNVVGDHCQVTLALEVLDVRHLDEVGGEIKFPSHADEHLGKGQAVGGPALEHFHGGSGTSGLVLHAEHGRLGHHLDQAIQTLVPFGPADRIVNPGGHFVVQRERHECMADFAALKLTQQRVLARLAHTGGGASQSQRSQKRHHRRPIRPAAADSRFDVPRSHSGNTLHRRPHHLSAVDPQPARTPQDSHGAEGPAAPRRDPASGRQICVRTRLAAR